MQPVPDFGHDLRSVDFNQRWLATICNLLAPGPVVAKTGAEQGEAAF
jgi:hypothetical protein